MSDLLNSIIGLDEDLPVTEKHDVYPYISPEPAFASQSYAGKVVLVTGASRGIGSQTAIDFAKAGASLVLVARKQETLDESKQAILKEKPDAKVVTFPADVVDSGKAKEAVEKAVEHFGRLDVVIANAGVFRNAQGKGFADSPTADEWWNVIEVNFRGVYNYLYHSIPELRKTKGVFITTTSRIALLRWRTASDYAVSKFAINRLIEFAALENPDIRAFTVHPGVVATEMNKTAGGIDAQDTVELPAAVYLHLAAGKADYFNGRYVSVNWDLEEVETKYKDKIVSSNALVEKLAIPA